MVPEPDRNAASASGSPRAGQPFTERPEEGIDPDRITALRQIASEENSANCPSPDNLPALKVPVLPLRRSAHRATVSNSRLINPDGIVAAARSRICAGIDSVVPGPPWDACWNLPTRGPRHQSALVRQIEAAGHSGRRTSGCACMCWVFASGGNRGRTRSRTARCTGTRASRGLYPLRRMKVFAPEA
jgi:hypothetical protein